MDLHNVEDTGLTPAEQEDMQDAWRVNTAAVGEAVLAKGGFAVPYFIGMPRNVRYLTTAFSHYMLLQSCSYDLHLGLVD
eukprot:COSAG02_NODE_185_length_30442_cov_59.370168_12_plen_79_part_00